MRAPRRFVGRQLHFALALLCCCCCHSHHVIGMVKEGHDSTVRPKVQTFEFDNGKMFMDAWAADGKAMFSRRFLGWSRVANVLGCTGICAVLFFMDHGNDDHVFSTARQATLNWWGTFVEMDMYDVKKAKSVGGPS